MSKIDLDTVFKQLKKQNGELFAQIIRGDNHEIDRNNTTREDWLSDTADMLIANGIMDTNPWTPVINAPAGNLLDVPNIVHILEFAGRDPYDAKALAPVIKEIYKTDKEPEYHSTQDPIALLDKAGYKAWYVKHSAEKQNAIAGYFRSQKAVDYGFTGGNPRTNVSRSDSINGELICTIYGNLDYGSKRCDDWHIINAVKKECWGDDKLPEEQWHIKPSDNPKREDEYGTSVISIQIARSGGAISIKNRYNHTLIHENPDATFNNNPDNIIPGLSESLKRHFGVDFKTSNTPLPQNFCIVNDQLVRYEHERNNVYFGDDYYVSGSDIIKLNSDYEHMMDFFILDTRTGTVRYPVQDAFDTEDETLSFLNKLFEHKKIKIQKNKVQTGEIQINNTKKKITVSQKIIFADGVQIMTLENGQIVELNLQDVAELGDNILSGNKVLRKLTAPKLRKTGKDFLTCNESLTELNLPELVSMGPYSLQNLRALKSINLPRAKNIGYLWIPSQTDLQELYLPEFPEKELERLSDRNEPKLNRLLLINKLKTATNRINKTIDQKVKELDQEMERKQEKLKEKMEQDQEKLQQKLKKLDEIVSGYK